MEADKNLFSAKIKMFEALFYLPHIISINVIKEYEEG